MVDDAERLARIKRSANAAMAGVDPEHQPGREDIFRVSDVLWLLDQVDDTRVRAKIDGQTYDLGEG